jgi:glycosyltransferase involved in cell wall biosynthesis
MLAGALDSLCRQDLAPGSFEVIVVDNNSTDATPAVVSSRRESFAHFQGLTEARQGLSHARNCGWRAAQGCFVAFLDDDAKAAPDWCRSILTAFESVKPDPDSVGGVILPWYDGPVPTWFADSFETRSWGDAPGFLKGYLAQYGFSGSNMAFPKGRLEEFGGFSSDFGMCGSTLRMGEEADLYFRMYRAGLRFWYDPAIIVSHYVPCGHMRVAYRLQRAFRSGQARATIDGHRCFSPAYRSELKALPFLLKELTLCLLGVRSRTIRDVIVRLCGLSHQAGYLTACRPRKGTRRA